MVVSAKEKPGVIKFVALVMIIIGALYLGGGILASANYYMYEQGTLFGTLALIGGFIQIVIGLPVFVFGIGLWRLMPFAFQWLMTLMRMPIIILVIAGFFAFSFGSVFGMIGLVIGLVFAIFFMAAIFSPSTRRAIESYDYERPSYEGYQQVYAERAQSKEPMAAKQSYEETWVKVQMGEETKICPNCNTANHESARQCSLCARHFDKTIK